MPIVTIRIVETIVMDTDTNQIISSNRTVENSAGEGVAVTTKKAAPKKKEVVVEPTNDKPSVKLEDNKLVLNPTAVHLLGATAGDRICVSYTQLKNGTFIPVIGTQEKMGDNVAGNKLTKALTVSYKGKQATTLGQYGVEFTLAMLEDGTAKLLDPNHEGLEDISEDELVPMPEITAETANMSDGDFLDNLNQGSTNESFEKSDDSIIFDFDLSNM